MICHLTKAIKSKRAAVQAKAIRISKPKSAITSPKSECNGKVNNLAVYTRTSNQKNFKGDSTARQCRATKHLLPKFAKIKKVSECISGMLPLKERKVLQSLLNGSFEAVYVESARALSRRADVIEAIYKKAKTTNTKLIVADMPGAFKFDASPAENFQRRIMAAVMEFQRDMVVYNLQAGLQAARAKAKKAGKPGAKVLGGNWWRLQLVLALNMPPPPFNICSMFLNVFDLLHIWGGVYGVKVGSSIQKPDEMDRSTSTGRLVNIISV